LNSMDYVLAVYNEKSFSKAAKKLFISQPALSATIRKVEDEIGYPLFDRSILPIRPTPVGRKYIQMINEINAVKNNFYFYLENMENLATGILVIGATHFFSACFLPKFITAFMRDFPGVAVELVESNSTELEQKLLNGDIDLQIDSRSFNADLFSSIPVRKENIILASPKNHPINQLLEPFQLTYEDISYDRHMDPEFPSVDLHLFQSEPLLLFKPGNDLNNRATAICREYDFQPVVKMYLNQLPTIHSLTSEGLGFSFVTDTLVKFNSAFHNVVYYKLESKHAIRDINAAYKRNRFHIRAIDQFITQLRSQIPECSEEKKSLKVAQG
jgi:DNA-binding transcriptional LysR family regulator